MVNRTNISISDPYFKKRFRLLVIVTALAYLRCIIFPRVQMICQLLSNCLRHLDDKSCLPY